MSVFWRCFVPVLVISVIAFIVFNIMMALFISAVIAERRQDERERAAAAALQASQNAVVKTA